MWLAAFCKPKNCTYQLPLGETDAFGFEVLPKVAVQIICKSRFTYDDLGMGRATCICLPEESDGFESSSFGAKNGNSLGLITHIPSARPIPTSNTHLASVTSV